ncbi:hypothetical protein [Streptomyces sp. JB150]|uniref:hypothetical protein n=1 Tax=Streptomyces sp. JB150 TaxID=2714844 RepID=UPI00140DBDA4|nr:hypothetical protein [Streptomyces sp. JB150]QIJ63778.1 hypothetical protein G7Z13_18450 [Streptomyces sp. JB150]
MTMFRRFLASAMVVATGVGGGLSAPSTANAQDYGPNTCRQGYVWRVARAGDLVCVTPQTRANTAHDNALAPGRTLPNGYCVQGYVWREAWGSDDHTCVTPQARAQAGYDNSRADDRRLAVRLWVTSENGSLKVSGDHFNINRRVRLVFSGAVNRSWTVTATRHAGYAGGSFGFTPGFPGRCAPGNPNARVYAVDLTSGRTTASVPFVYCVRID